MNSAFAASFGSSRPAEIFRLNHAQPRMRFDRAQIFQAAGGKIVDDNDRFVIGQQALDEVRTDETRAASYQNKRRWRIEVGRWHSRFVLPQRVRDGLGELLTEFRALNQPGFVGI